MVLLYGGAERITAQTGGFRPGQFDTLGLLTRTAADAAAVYCAYEQRPAIRPAALAGLRLGRCVSQWFSQGWPKSRDLAWCFH